MKFAKVRPSPELDALIRDAANHKMTRAEKREQKISFVYGQLGFTENPPTKEHVARVLDDMEGDG